MPTKQGEDTAAKKRYYSTCHPYSKHKRRHPFYRALRCTIRRFYPTHKLEWTHPPDSDAPAIFVCNHDRAYGPVVLAVTLKRKYRPWVAQGMCFLRSVPAYARDDFWDPQTPLAKAGVYILSYLIAPIAALLMRAIEAVPVYKDSRMRITFDKSVETLREGVDLVIYPEDWHPLTHDTKTTEFPAGFIHVAKKYYRATKKRVAVYPMFADYASRTVRIGTPYVYNPEPPLAQEKQAMIEHVCGEMRALALALRDASAASEGDAPCA